MYRIRVKENEFREIQKTIEEEIKQTLESGIHISNTVY
jgi:hypothetical protein